MAKPFVILSLSGGGYCGLYTARILELIEEQRGGVPISQSVDLIAGTSIGGILALGLAHGIPAKNLKTALTDHGPEIFWDSGSRLKRISRNSWAFCRQLIKSKYPSERLKSAIEEMIPSRLFIEADVPCAVPSVRVTTGSPHIFRNYDCADAELASTSVALATSAAPTYFPPYWRAPDKFIDGGLVANNPDILAVSDAVSYFRQPLTDVVVLSIGALNFDVGAAGRKRGFSGIIPNAFSIRQAISFTLEVQQGLSSDLTSKMLGDNYCRVTTIPNESKKRATGLDIATGTATDTLIGMADSEFHGSVRHRVMRIFCNGHLDKATRWKNGEILPGFALH